MNTLHYPSLELCERLTEIGFPETEIFICNRTLKPKIVYKKDKWTFDYENCIVHPSVMEMLEVSL